MTLNGRHAVHCIKDASFGAQHCAIELLLLQPLPFSFYIYIYLSKVSIWSSCGPIYCCLKGILYVLTVIRSIFWKIIWCAWCSIIFCLPIYTIINDGEDNLRFGLLCNSHMIYTVAAEIIHDTGSIFIIKWPFGPHILSSESYTLCPHGGKVLVFEGRSAWVTQHNFLTFLVS